MTYVNENEITHPCQIGFMPGNRTADCGSHINAKNTIMEKFMPALLILRKPSIQFGTTASS
jgi:hypothetical protein